ncbi:MAG: hypothetical protein J1F05_01940 [Muribaculaceae bacterium]|nr:hypothetical protein [Muribaculaceae bacterium]
MRRFILILSFLWLTIMANAQTKIEITIDNNTMCATLAENGATKALIEKLSSGPITITMDNYGGFEKVGALPWSLPASDTRITTKPGDIMLYTSNNIVIFYGTNTWSYTPLGVLDSTISSEISAFVGSGTKKVTISLVESAGIEVVDKDVAATKRVYSLDGKSVAQRPLKAGVYIIDNKKVIVK